MVSDSRSVILVSNSTKTSWSLTAGLSVSIMTWSLTAGLSVSIKTSWCLTAGLSHSIKKAVWQHVCKYGKMPLKSKQSKTTQILLIYADFLSNYLYTASYLMELFPANKRQDSFNNQVYVFQSINAITVSVCYVAMYYWPSIISECGAILHPCPSALRNESMQSVSLLHLQGSVIQSAFVLFLSSPNVHSANTHCQ